MDMLALSALPVLALASALAPQDAQSVLAAAQSKQAERWATVDDYTVVREINGIEVTSWYRKFEVDGRTLFRQVPRTEWQRQRAEAEGGVVMTSEDYEAYADASEQLGDAMMSELAKEGVPPIPGFDFGQMMDDQALFLRFAASYEENDGRADAAEAAAGMASFADRARLVGREDVDGRQAFHLVADDLPDLPEQSAGDARFTLKRASLWLDADEYVPLRVRIEGVMEADGEERDVVIERLDQSYERAGPLYESRRQVMRLSGMMEALSPEDRKKMEEARAELEKLEAQMDQIPPAARGMVERQMDRMKTQLAMMNDEGVFETVIDVVRIGVNEGPPEK
ncbi:MAG: hypothetical protein PVH00_11215 [Gemmatimonadota bacterium]|jgi:hypothetical protein